MIVSRAWEGRRFAVLGLARSGAATVRALVAGGAHVTAWDSDAGRREAMADAVQDLSKSLDTANLSIADLDTLDLSGFDALVVSPGVPLNTHPLAARATEAGVPVIGDIELFAQARADLPAHKVVGITGTNGKSTTTALVTHICKEAGVPVLMGGNIGLPILAQEPLPAGGVYVLELSSYQIDLTDGLDCDVAVLLNVTPDHLDRYNGLSAYAASKARLFAMQRAPHVAVVDHRAQAEHAVLDGAAADLPILFIDDVPLDGQSGWPSLQGPHNLHNARAAVAACRALGVEDRVIERALRSFNGLPHRMERVATINGVTYVNDSKATNPDSVAPALAAYPRVHWIVGGQAKSDDLDACAPAFGHVVRAYTIGDAGPRFAAILKDRVPVEEAGTLDTAVRLAAAQARAGEVVLLSPACASFDQFRDFEDRGRAFRAAVEALGVGAGA